jgi:signal peptidase I
MSATQTSRGGVRRAARWTVNLVLLGVVLGCAAWLAPTALGYSRYVITGGSMSGTFEKGSVVFEKPVAVDDLRVGDVITYLPPADSGVPNLVTHRVVDIEPREGGGSLFTTRGDANPAVDPWKFALTSEVQPVVQFSVPKAGWVFIALADRQTRMLLIGVPAGLIALMALAQLVGAVRRPDAEPEADPSSTPDSAPRVPAQRRPSEYVPTGRPVVGPLEGAAASEVAARP